MNVGFVELDVRPALFVAGGTFPAQGAGAARQKRDFGPIQIPAKGKVTFVVEGTPGLPPGGGRTNARVESISMGGRDIPLQPSCNGGNPSSCTSTWTAVGAGSITGEVNGPIPAVGSAQPAQDYTLAVFFEGDVLSPEVALLDPNTRYFLGSSPAIAAVAIDDGSVVSISAAFDLNGDGDTSDAGEKASATPDGEGVAPGRPPQPAHRSAWLSACRTRGTGRVREHRHERRYRAGSKRRRNSRDRNPIPRSRRSRRPRRHGRGRARGDRRQRLRSVVVSFDRNGDGDTSDAGETLKADSLGEETYRAVFGEVDGRARTAHHYRSGHR